MNLSKLVLGSAGITVAIIGVVYLADPNLLLNLYGVSIDSATEANIVRSAYGGLFLAFGIVFLLGTVKPQLELIAQVTLLLFMGGFALGRLVSFIFDGQPHPFLVGLFAMEIVYTAATLFLICRGGN